MIIIKNINTPNNTNDQTPPSRLQLLITAAQSGDRQALLQLCEDFSPLLKSEAHREMFYRSLGKDAEGIAVLALIELILKYAGADFANWPGLARCKVHFALFDAMQKQGQIWENEAQVDTDSAAGTELLEACRAGPAFTVAGSAGSSASAEPRPAAGDDAAVRTGAETFRSSKTFRLQCTQCHQAPIKSAGQTARAAIKIQKDCRLAVLFLRRFI